MRLLPALVVAAFPALAVAQPVAVPMVHAPAVFLAAAASVASATHSVGSSVNLVVRQADLDTFANQARSENPRTAAPVLTHAVQADFTPMEIAHHSSATVHLTVDQNGLPKNITILSASSPDVATRTLAAVSQYRFAPARANFVAVNADINITVQIKGE